ncbi:hypothetical protein [Cellulomonas olei]|uniref:hypothetical protein n=1 Tax=Cellulomonas sp. P4 TaxID=3142533 RepID=UPI0031BB43D3
MSGSGPVPTICRVGEVLPPATAPTRPDRPAHRAPTPAVRHVLDLRLALRSWPAAPPRERAPRHRASVPFEVQLERDLAAVDFSLPTYLERA